MTTAIAIALVIGVVVVLAIGGVLLVGLLPTGSVPRIAPDSLRHSGIIHGLLDGGDGGGGLLG